MNFEDIGRVWREEGTGEYRRRRIEDLSAVLDRAMRLNAAVRRRMRVYGWVVAVPLALVFAFMALRAPTALAAVGAGILAAWAMVVLLVYRAMSRRGSDAALPVRLAIETEVGHLRALERFGRRAKWHRAVLAGGYLLYTFGVVTEVDDAGVRVTAMALFLMFFGSIELAIYVARRRGPGPTRSLREDLESWLEGLEAIEASAIEDAGNMDLTGGAR